MEGKVSKSAFQFFKYYFRHTYIPGTLNVELDLMYIVRFGNSFNRAYVIEN